MLRIPGLRFIRDEEIACISCQASSNTKSLAKARSTQSCFINQRPNICRIHNMFLGVLCVFAKILLRHHNTVRQAHSRVRRA